METQDAWKKNLLTKFWAERSNDIDVFGKTMLKCVLKKEYGNLWTEFD